MTLRPVALVLLLGSLCIEGNAQDVTRYERFELRGEELYWRHDYAYPGDADSIRRHVVRMLKSKFFTFNVIRNETGYNGEIRHYKVDCRRYQRTYMNTPRMYWEGEWTGKFIVEVQQGGYKLTIYALYYDKHEKSTDYYKTEKLVRGRYFNAVTKKHGTSLKKGEFSNMALMSMSLKDDFDIKNTIAPDDN